MDVEAAAGSYIQSCRRSLHGDSRHDRTGHQSKIAAALMDALIRVLSHGYDIHDLWRTANDDNAPWRTDLSTLLISRVTRNETSMQLPQQHGLAHVVDTP